VTKVRFSTKFRKQYQKSSLKIKNAFDFRLNLFLIDPNNPILNDHHLIGQYKGYSSFNVNGDWRAIYSQYSNDEIIIELLGTHSQLYK